MVWARGQRFLGSNDHRDKFWGCSWVHSFRGQQGGCGEIGLPDGGEGPGAEVAAPWEYLDTFRQVFRAPHLPGRVLGGRGGGGSRSTAL